MAGDDLHDNLLAEIPDARAVECDGHGWLSITWADRTTAAKCPRCATRVLRLAIGEFIPKRFREPVEVDEQITEWAMRGPKAEGLYLAGQVGTGKTHAAWMAVAAWCLAANVAPRGEDFRHSPYSDQRTRVKPTVIFARMTDLLDNFRPGPDDSVQHVRDCQDANLLVIDDLGAEKPSEWTQERLYSVIDHRYANCLPLLVTGNLPPGKLAEQTGDRVASRLAEMCTVVPMTGSDRRRAA